MKSKKIEKIVQNKIQDTHIKNDLQAENKSGANEKTVDRKKVVCENLSKTYAKKTVVKNFNAEFERGKVYGLLGPTSSGKSVIMKILTGLTQPSEGRVSIRGKSPSYKTRAFVSYLPDCEFFDDDMKVHELVTLYKDFFADFNEKRALKAIAHLGVDLNDKYKNMSRSSQRRIEVVVVMNRKAKVFLLDEPVACVEPKARDFVIKTIVNNIREDSIVIISSKVVADIYKIMDEVKFIYKGEVKLSATLDEIRYEYGKEVDALYKEVFRC